ncbi:hypothetical protein BO221_11990 [Archangium sp. Cb G35]|uniref:hypothetical protein n=1 Tax=Archangium sp. Cb G35 TaxID=1920190 RepID=UPI000935D621|nr:hypothetical protein [Archangium sp. Cb G35]OJT25092.1 hypothetical protein BO221_11990 [Archangium sp. Cb G35]
MKQNWMKWMAAGLALLAPPALAESPAKKAPAQELSAGVTSVFHGSFYSLSPTIYAAEVAYNRALAAEGFWSRVRIGGGVRGGLPDRLVTVPLEVYVQARLTARLGIWEGAAGPEVGVGGMSTLYPLLGDNDGGHLEDRLVGPMYFGFGAAPLRFHLGPVLLSGLEFNFAATGLPLGSASAIRVTLLRLGVSL